eukprot:TRINITY_DN26195_c0_g1_i1.p1 TRINITY_DN26195_c0_g1~~TRINITY_DN26195_c0_g1_i1.p1  ORF type:complete len:430 (-),score=68.59 TRINITY_DN26195_c0_g1_i1:69-1358(-)
MEDDGGGEWTTVRSRNKRKGKQTNGKQSNGLIEQQPANHEQMNGHQEPLANGHHHEETNGHHEETNGHQIKEIPDWGAFNCAQVDELLKISEPGRKPNTIKIPTAEFTNYLNQIRQFKNQNLESNVFLYQGFNTTFINSTILSQITSSRIYIQQLDLSNSNVSNQNLKSLSYLKSTLTHLNLHNTPISDPGIEDLISFKSLKHLDISSTNILGSAFTKWREICFKSFKDSKKSLQLIHQQSLPSLEVASSNRKQRRELFKKSLSSSGLHASDSIQFQLETLSLSFSISNGTLFDFFSWSAPKIFSHLKTLQISVDQISRRLVEVISPFSLFSLQLIGNWKQVVPLSNLKILTQISSLREISLSRFFLSSEPSTEDSFFRLKQSSNKKSRGNKKINKEASDEEDKEESEVKFIDLRKTNIGESIYQRRFH